MTIESKTILGLIIPIVFVSLICCTDEDSRELLPDVQSDNETSMVYTIDEKISAIKEAERLGQYRPASDFEAVGLYLSPGQAIEIDVKILEGNSQPKLLVGTYSRIKWSDKPTAYDLDEGYNSIVDDVGGLLYLK